MLQCRSCGSTVTGNFCTNCGVQVAAGPMRCPRCNNEAAPGTAFCAYCGSALSASQQQYGAPYPNQPVPQQQQNNVGKYLIGALGGAAAAIGGEMLLHGAERQIERGIEGDIMRREWRGEGHHHHHHNNHHRRCHCGHEFGIDIDICPRCRRRWGSW